jgi:hypothetical protein
LRVLPVVQLEGTKSSGTRETTNVSEKIKIFVFNEYDPVM